MGPKIRKKLTREEKAALKAQKLLAKQERERQAQRDKLLRHMAVSSVNRKMVQRKYREIIYRTQMPILRQDVETMWHRFDFGLELKNYNISSLLDDINSDELQVCYNQAAHLSAMDHLLGENEQHLVDLRKWYEGERDGLLSAGVDFRKRAEDIQLTNEEDLGTTLWRMRAEQNASTAAYQEDAETRACELRNEYGDMMNLMRIERERQLNKLWASCHGTVANYRCTTAQRREEHDHLLQQDLEFEDDRLADLYEEVHELQLRLQEAHRWQSERLGVLQKERDSYAALYTTLMSDKEAGTKTDKERATHLAVCSAAVTKRLQHLQQKAELILELTTLCRKYEMQEEKVVPFPKSSLEVPDASEEQMPGTFIMEQLQGTNDTLTLMDHFWQKVAKVQMRHTELQFIHNHLQSENKELKQKLQHYIQELAPHKQINVSL